VRRAIRIAFERDGGHDVSTIRRAKR
jgi:hypothetical protein